MAGTKSGVILSEGETVLVELETEFLPTKCWDKFFTREKSVGFIVITNKKVIEVRRNFKFGKETGSEISYIMPSAIVEIGIESTSFSCCCGSCCKSSAYDLYYKTLSKTVSVPLDSSDPAGAQKILDSLYTSIKGLQVGVNG